MKTINRLWLAGAALAAFAASNASAQILNSRHNFSSYGWSGGEVCKPCHTPHFANATAGKLWNHALTDATYTMMDGTGTAAADMDRVSRLCLSCHDGTVALDSFGGQQGTNFMPAPANLGTDLTNDHPVGRPAQYPPTPLPSWWNGAFRDPTTFSSAVRLARWTDNGGVEHNVVGCKTCHNPHNKGFPNLLVMSNASSALCLNCHIK
jgi:predicted CXXCH cytochrome family protein